MGALKNGGYPVVLNGKEYSLLFSLNALDEIQDKFGGYDKLAEVFNENNPEWIKQTKWLLTLLINEGLLSEDEDAKLLTETQVGRLISVGNLPDIQNAIFSAFATGTSGDGDLKEEQEPDKEGEAKGAQES